MESSRNFEGSSVPDPDWLDTVFEKIGSKSSKEREAVIVGFLLPTLQSGNKNKPKTDQRFIPSFLYFLHSIL